MFFFGGETKPDFFPNLSEAPASNLQHRLSHHLVAHHGISAAHDLLQPGDHGRCMQLFGCDVRDGRFEDGVKMVKDEVKNGWIYFCQIGYIYILYVFVVDVYWLVYTF